ncbi:hypothetical protein [Knoellia subterranea]|uniref:Uncharacterized protein n=1 Tax=Knoellia subterranea KCTC 19937 TaxID=1385521 RepID=A0A0A0JI09_9MICO|nr:hypothetical protein [Knoellia subterranea]KGN35692.1 hypothetical protein N803_06375 [Knoellia subterranea KCTC 19937]
MEILLKEQPDGKTMIELAPVGPAEARPHLSRLLIDSPIDKLPGDRLAVASALIFQQHFRGMVRLPKPVSPEIAAHLTKLRQPVWCSVGPVDDTGSQHGGRGTTLVLDIDHAWLEAANTVDSGARVVVTLLRGDKWSGRIFSMDRLAVASNVWLFDSGEDSVRALTPYLGVALLLGGDLECSRMYLPHTRRPDPEWETYVTTLMSAIGVELTFCTPTDVGHLLRDSGVSRVR